MNDVGLATFAPLLTTIKTTVEGTIRTSVLESLHHITMEIVFGPNGVEDLARRNDLHHLLVISLIQLLQFNVGLVIVGNSLGTLRIT